MYYAFHKGGEKESNFFSLQFSASQIILVFIVWLFHKSESCFSLQQQGDFNYLVYMKIFFVLCIKYVLLEVNSHTQRCSDKYTST